MTPTPGMASHATPPAVRILATVMLLLPALGSPSTLLVQDTLKSSLLCLGTLLATLLWLHRASQRRDAAPLQLHIVLLVPLALMLYALGSMYWSHAYLGGAEAVRWAMVGLLMWLTMNSITPMVSRRLSSSSITRMVCIAGCFINCTKQTRIE